MPDHTILYRLPRAAFDPFARAYYRGARVPPLGVTEAVDLGSLVGDLSWLLDRDQIRERFFGSMWWERVGHGLAAAWAGGTPPDGYGPAVRRAIRGKPMAREGGGPGDGAGFWPPNYVAGVAERVAGPRPDAGAVRDALHDVRADIAARLDPVADGFRLTDALFGEVEAAARAFGRFDVLGFARSVSAALSTFEAVQALPPRPRPAGPPMTTWDWACLEKSAVAADELLAQVDAWIDGEADRRLATAQAFLGRAASTGEYVVSEPRLGVP